ncbi:hypothetical protein ACLOJK_029045 [Asimina triloba]
MLLPDQTVDAAIAIDFKRHGGHSKIWSLIRGEVVALLPIHVAGIYGDLSLSLPAARGRNGFAESLDLKLSDLMDAHCWPPDDRDTAAHTAIDCRKDGRRVAA